MSDVTDLTYERVASVANRLKDEGKKVSARTIKNELDSGSMATIHKFFKVWESKQENSQPSACDDVSPTFLEACRKEFKINTQIGTSELKEAVAELTDINNAICNENFKLKESNETLTTQLADIHDQLISANSRIAEIQSDAADIKAELNSERKAHETTKIELAKALFELESLSLLKVEKEKLAAKIDKVETDNEKLRADLSNSEAQNNADAVTIAKLSMENNNLKTNAGHYEREQHLSEERFKQTNSEAQISKIEAAELRGRLSVFEKKVQFHSPQKPSKKGKGNVKQPDNQPANMSAGEKPH